MQLLLPFWTFFSTCSRMKRLSSFSFSLLFVFFIPFLIVFISDLDAAANDKTSAAHSPFHVHTVVIQGPITPIQKDLLESALDSAVSNKADMLLLQLDTPGGLVTTMRDMVKLMLNAPFPVCVWVGPSGAHAASAGVFLVAASSLAGMSPQATIGAASPVSMGGEDVPETMSQKIINDITSLLRSIAETRNRNVEWYSASVTDAISVTAQEAVMLKVVEFVAEDVNDFLTQAGRRGVPFHAKQLRFSPDTVTVSDYTPGIRHAFLAWLLHPQIAYLLLLGGMAGLFFELTNPGAIFPGVFGGLCLLVSLYAMSVLPTNTAGVLLILFSIVLYLMEIKITSFGLLGVAGTVCLLIGSMILFPSGQGFSLPISTILPTVLVISSLMFLAVYLVAKAYRTRPQTGSEALSGEIGKVQEWSSSSGKVYLQGALWNAVSNETITLQHGEAVRIVGRKGLTLVVTPASKPSLMV